MESWLQSNASEEPKNVLLVHQPDIHSSTTSMVLVCLITIMNRHLFVEGASEALPFIQDLAQNFPYTKMSGS